MSVIEKNGCAVLAGGEGKRMGQLNKAELVYDGQTFLAHICSEFEKAGLKGYISVANYDQNVPDGWTAIRDCVTDAERKFIGPIAGIYSCLLQAEKDKLEGLFFAPCDTPFFNVDLIETICREIESVENYNAAVIRTSDGRLHPTTGWYSIKAIPFLKSNIEQGKYRLKDVLEKMSTLEIKTTEAGMHDSVLTNINYEDDYRFIR